MVQVETPVVQLFRTYEEQGTFGTLVTDGFSCVTVERPWRDNKNKVSCIPEGTYRCEFGASSKNIPVSNMAYEVLDVPNRTVIKIHIANWPADLEGCIGLGKEIYKSPDGNKMVTKSAQTVVAFHNFMDGGNFTLVISKAG